MSKIDDNMLSALELYFKYGIHPGSCTSCIIVDDYDGAYARAHPHLKHTKELFNEIYNTARQCMVPQSSIMSEWFGYKSLDKDDPVAFEIILSSNRLIQKWISDLEKEGA